MIRSRAASPFAVLRQARITDAPLAANPRAASSPRPLLAPVTTMVLPERSGMSSTVQLMDRLFLRLEGRLSNSRPRGDAEHGAAGGHDVDLAGGVLPEARDLPAGVQLRPF